MILEIDITLGIHKNYMKLLSLNDDDKHRKDFLLGLVKKESNRFDLCQNIDNNVSQTNLEKVRGLDSMVRDYIKIFGFKPESELEGDNDVDLNETI